MHIAKKKKYKKTLLLFLIFVFLLFLICWSSFIHLIFQSQVTTLYLIQATSSYFATTQFGRKNTNNLFGICMECFCGTEICWRIVIFLLRKMVYKFNLQNFWIYHEDGWIFLRIVMLWCRLCYKIYKIHLLNLDVASKLKTVNFLIITFDLNNGMQQPSRKLNNQPYIH